VDGDHWQISDMEGSGVGDLDVREVSGGGV
jgi:hypothetical protein